MYASRNIRLCTKDCLCLMVCPTGATNTENGQIDRETCISGCRRCVDACPSHAIYLVLDDYPDPPQKPASVVESMLALLDRKADQEAVVRAMLKADDGSDSQLTQLLKALENSLRVVSEDCAREAGYMHPEASATKALEAELGG
jgi:Fe-S-cluster-containing hydrogenase component 2